MKSLRNGLTGLTLDRCALRRSEAAWLDDPTRRQTARYLPLHGVRGLVGGDPLGAVFLDHVAVAPVLDAAEACVFLGCQAEVPYFALGFPQEAQLPRIWEEDGRRFVGLRQVAGILPPADAALTAYARAMVWWHGRSRYCGRCGAPTVSGEGGFVRSCSDAACGSQYFPRTDAAIIVLVHAGERCLLGRQAGWVEGMHSVLAGFLEPGESFEAAVCREVAEESGVVVDGVTYHSSQPWPFPGSIMVGFTAHALSEEIRLLDRELEAAQWFTREALCQSLERGELRLPAPISISYRLIEDWFDAAAGYRLADWVAADGGD